MICRYKWVQSNLCYCCHPFVLCVYVGSHEQRHDQVEEWEHGMDDVMAVHDQVENVKNSHQDPFYLFLQLQF